MRQIMIAPAKKITLEVADSVHLTGPDLLEVDNPLNHSLGRIPKNVWEVLADPPEGLEWSGIKAINIEDYTAYEHGAQFVAQNRLVMVSPSKKLTLDLEDSVRVLGPETLEIDAPAYLGGGRTKVSVWDLLANHFFGDGAGLKVSGVQVLSVADDTEAA